MAANSNPLLALRAARAALCVSSSEPQTRLLAGLAPCPTLTRRLAILRGLQADSSRGGRMTRSGGFVCQKTRAEDARGGRVQLLRVLGRRGLCSVRDLCDPCCSPAGPRVCLCDSNLVCLVSPR